MSRITRFLCYFFGLKFTSVLFLTLFPSLFQQEKAIRNGFPWLKAFTLFRKNMSQFYPCDSFLNVITPSRSHYQVICNIIYSNIRTIKFQFTIMMVVLIMIMIIIMIINKLTEFSHNIRTIKFQFMFIIFLMMMILIMIIKTVTHMISEKFMIINHDDGVLNDRRHHHDHQDGYSLKLTLPGAGVPKPEGSWAQTGASTLGYFRILSHYL